MARREHDEQPRKRFSRSGHTSHSPSALPPLPPLPTGTAPAPPTQPYPPVPGPPPQYGPPQYGPPQYGSPPRVDGFGAATYHNGSPGPDAFAAEAANKQGRNISAAARATALGTAKGAKFVTNKVISASKADGAHQSGLTALIWNQVLSYGTDAMITVALASTVFFGASTHAQRGNVLIYLLVTMAPFALVAPIIGPALDRVQHGRRWAMAGSGLGRALLAIIMAAHATDLVVLYPCALGSLVFSKAYSVIRGAAAPRLVPPGMTLVEANARLSIFGLGAALAGGGLIGAIIKVSGSNSAGLWVTAIAFGACAYSAIKLPKQVDSATSADRHPDKPARPRGQQRVPLMTRLLSWAQRGFPPPVIISLQGESALRFISGFLTIFMAFWVESTRHGFTAAIALGFVIGAVGVGNFAGTALGTRLKLTRPEIVITTCAAVSGAFCLLAAILFNIEFAALGMLLTSATNSLGKIALDAVIQRDVAETLRSSAFARSETFLQLAWVLGAAIACLLPSGNGSLGFWVATAAVGAVAALLVLRSRALSHTGDPPVAPGNLRPGPSQ
jgi:hypothetical protein